jgi:hypothetical protein
MPRPQATLPAAQEPAGTERRASSNASHANGPLNGHAFVLIRTCDRCVWAAGKAPTGLRAARPRTIEKRDRPYCNKRDTGTRKSIPRVAVATGRPQTPCRRAPRPVIRKLRRGGRDRSPAPPILFRGCLTCLHATMHSSNRQGRLNNKAAVSTPRCNTRTDS